MNEAPRLSPDGRWVAYTTNEAGFRQIVVRPFPDTSGGLWQISTNDGMEPDWRGDGTELFYLGLDGMLMAVDVESGEVFGFGAPRALFPTGTAIPPTRVVAHMDSPSERIAPAATHAPPELAERYRNY